MLAKEHWRLIPTYFLVNRIKNRNSIFLEIDAWLKCKDMYNKQQTDYYKLGILLKNKKDAYRNLLGKRVLENGGLIPKFTYKFLNVFYPGIDSLYINTKDIGENFLINHGFSTIITAKSIGNDCMISQQVTIGVKKPKGGLPTIGNNVSIYCGAKVLGDIVIGDNVVIGANAVVISNIPSNCVVAGVPAKVIKYMDDYQISLNFYELRGNHIN